ncbi:MAG: 30S ribosomal protein S8 [Verrucomicrobiae bacterium]|nr:30S ribosomal protein S8 [Verrucomicrobiae bacterium]
MNITDPIADMCTRIRNAVRAGKEEVDVPFSKMKSAIAKILKKEGYVLEYKVETVEEHNVLRIKLKYSKKKPAIVGIKRISTPGHRVYSAADAMPRVLGGMGIAIVTTSRGLMSGHEARRVNAGGEVLCQVW